MKKIIYLIKSLFLYTKSKLIKETSTNNVEVLHINYKNKSIPICFYYNIEKKKFHFLIDTDYCIKNNIDVDDFISYTSNLLKKELNIY